MPENTSIPAPTPTPQPAASTPAPTGINQALALSLTRVENVTRAAITTERLAVLGADGSDITQELLDSIFAEVGAVRRLLGIASQQTTDKEEATEESLTLEERLIRAIQAVQARARQKYGARSAALANYHIGDRLADNRAVLEQASKDILTALEYDPLPGITAARVAALEALRDAYVQSESEQTTAGGEAATTRRLAKDRLDALVEKRQKIQFAADAIWPWHDPSNVGVRKEFDLPASRPYAG
jgi:hypothetical protein